MRGSPLCPGQESAYDQLHECRVGGTRRQVRLSQKLLLIIHESSDVTVSVQMCFVLVSRCSGTSATGLSPEVRDTCKDGRLEIGCCGNQRPSLRALILTHPETDIFRLWSRLVNPSPCGDSPAGDPRNSNLLALQGILVTADSSLGGIFQARCGRHVKTALYCSRATHIQYIRCAVPSVVPSQSRSAVSSPRRRTSSIHRLLYTILPALSLLSSSLCDSLFVHHAHSTNYGTIHVPCSRPCSRWLRVGCTYARNA